MSAVYAIVSPRRRQGAAQPLGHPVPGGVRPLQPRLGKGFRADENGALTVGIGCANSSRGADHHPNVDTLNWKFDQFDSFLPADNYEVFGFSVRNRTRDWASR